MSLAMVKTSVQQSQGVQDVEGKYFYAVILCNGNHDLDLTGLQGCKVHTIAYKDIAAVVSDHPVEKVSMIRKNLSPYHDVTRRFAETCTTIPAKFGQIAESEERLVTVLRGSYSRIRKELERLDRKVEMGLKVTWEVTNLFEYFLRTDTALRTMRDRIYAAQTPPSKMQLIELGSFVSERMKIRKEAISERIVSALHDAVAEEKLDDPNEEKTVMSGWFLVSKEHQLGFVESVKEATGFLSEEYLIKINGPWVPFNFVEHIALDIHTDD
ncbi:MAG: GvpL/GvpF family gas vesicle protein [Ignavibacteriales bacterium]|nr:GvpL/GvpF family gas vesicle protein [Ignavibacteriales bacterium]